MKLLNFKKTVYLLLSFTFLLFTSCSRDDSSILEEETFLIDQKESLNSNLLAKSSSSVELSISSVSASASHSSTYAASKAIDGSLNTRWTANGTVYLYLDLGSSKLIDYVKVAHHAGSNRQYKMYFHVRNSTSGSWTQVGSKTSPGNSNALVDYDLTNSTNRYLRVMCTGNTSNGFSDIEEIEVWGTESTSGGGNSSTPGGVLGIDNSEWKLNGFTATPSSSATYYDDVMNQVNGNISTWSNSNYFYESNGWAYFKCYRGLGGSANSGNPRVELRERTNGSNASWNGDNGTHTMSFTVRVDQLPIGYDSDDNEDRTTGTVCFGQIHGPSGTNSDGVEVDDLIRLQFDGSAGQTSGSVKLKISGYITETQGGGSESYSGYSLDTSYDVQLIFSNDRVSVKINGSEVFGRTLNTAGNGSYFKAGNYLQSVQEGSFNGSYGLVGMKNLTVSH
ncbi:polysaccharide lyase family 7 protein [Polaribacter sp. Hel1_85]|uniref:polysaccharide lyase family 7 protein n=1 Tax=Polaribacter sp. Hel1_85 TaxID=1250005 RepID=UPI00052B6385|nr:polysaccharide lyase family 7 protein [Polaribacter sp. Hel1_85]KGL63643.1 alginate lyase (endo-guluronate lyase), CBM32 domain protein, PL7-3 family [Polaribacter sp. Hel1_85]